VESSTAALPSARAAPPAAQGEKRHRGCQQQRQRARFRQRHRGAGEATFEHVQAGGVDDVERLLDRGARADVGEGDREHRFLAIHQAGAQRQRVEEAVGGQGRVGLRDQRVPACG
jgi:hypothetical protein